MSKTRTMRPGVLWAGRNAVWLTLALLVGAYALIYIVDSGHMEVGTEWPFWYLLFLEGGMIENIQWALLGTTALTAMHSGTSMLNSGHRAVGGVGSHDTASRWACPAARTNLGRRTTTVLSPLWTWSSRNPLNSWQQVPYSLRPPVSPRAIERCRGRGAPQHVGGGGAPN